MNKPTQKSVFLIEYHMHNWNGNKFTGLQSYPLFILHTVKEVIDLLDTYCDIETVFNNDVLQIK